MIKWLFNRFFPPKGICQCCKAEVEGVTMCQECHQWLATW